MSALPDSARLALWFTAWRAGATSLDEARDAVVSGDAAHDVLTASGAAPRGEAEDPEIVSLILAFGRWRAAGATGAGVALPVPGDPLGLAGPPEFNELALEHGEGVVFTGTDLGAVPARAGAGVVWRCLPARSLRQVPDLSEADTGLRQAVVDVADALAGLDVARWRPEVADELMALRRPHDLLLPPQTSDRAGRMIGLATRCRAIAGLALADDGGALSVYDASGRRDALLALDHAARRALVAACQYSRER